MGDPSHLSREFRALVISIRGPLEEELSDRGAPAARRERLKTLHRNFMRLLQLVNTMFDVAQGAPGRRIGSELVDAGAETLIIPTLREVIVGEVTVGDATVGDAALRDGDVSVMSEPSPRDSSASEALASEHSETGSG